MNAQSITKLLEALRDVAEEAGAGDEFIVAVFEFCGMLAFFGMSDETKAHVERCVKVIRDTLDGVKVKMIREDKLN